MINISCLLPVQPAQQQVSYCSLFWLWKLQFWVEKALLNHGLGKRVLGIEHVSIHKERRTISSGYYASGQLKIHRCDGTIFHERHSR